MGRPHLKRRLLFFGACFAGERMPMPFVGREGMAGLAILPPVPWTGAQSMPRGQRIERKSHGRRECFTRSQMTPFAITSPESKLSVSTRFYALLPDETRWFLAVDFDKKCWMADAAAFAATCRRFEVQIAVERSRSGNGAHIWLFFDRPVLAANARTVIRELAFHAGEGGTDFPDCCARESLAKVNPTNKTRLAY
jgi:hypothetical protein